MSTIETKTPQEKAYELIKFLDTIQYDYDKNIAYTFNHFTIEEKKKLLIKFIDEIINEVGKLNVEISHTEYGEKLTEINGEVRTNYKAFVLYWNAVKWTIDIILDEKQPMVDFKFTISDDVLFEQATVEMEERYGSGCEEEIDAYFRGAKWMQKQFKNK